MRIKDLLDTSYDLTIQSDRALAEAAAQLADLLPYLSLRSKILFEAAQARVLQEQRARRQFAALEDSAVSALPFLF